LSPTVNCATGNAPNGKHRAASRAEATIAPLRDAIFYAGARVATTIPPLFRSSRVTIPWNSKIDREYDAPRTVSRRQFVEKIFQRLLAAEVRDC